MPNLFRDQLIGSGREGGLLGGLHVEQDVADVGLRWEAATMGSSNQGEAVWGVRLGGAGLQVHTTAHGRCKDRPLRHSIAAKPTLETSFSLSTSTNIATTRLN